MNDIISLLDKYYSWLKNETEWQEIDNEWTEITAPYIDRNNDYIQIYLKKTGNKFFLTDKGETITGLKQEGCSLEKTKRREELLNSTLKGYNVSLNGNELYVNAESDNFALKKHSLIQAILAVNDMVYLSEPYTASLFFEDVKNWFNLSNIHYAENVKVTGHSGYDRKFDFLIVKSSEKPERIIKIISKPARNNADSVIMDWLDTREGRPEGSQAYAFINDSQNTKSINSLDSLIDALKKYEINPVPWSKRDQYKEELAA